MSVPELTAKLSKADGRDVGAANGSSKPRVLIVDDNADAANSLGRLLTILGHDTFVVNDGRSAINQLESFRPAVVLLDLGMPGMDGLETAEHIKAHPAGASVALIAVTGWGQDHDRQRTTAAGFAEHLTKPVNAQQLEAAISDILKARSSAIRA